MRIRVNFWCVALAFTGLLAMPVYGQVFTVGEKSATADINTDFAPTRVDLPGGQLNERGRRELMRGLEAEQGFAHRVLPVAGILTLHANGRLAPESDGYKRMVYEKGQFASIGDRVAITSVDVKGDRIIIDLNGGPYVKHRFLRHIQIGIGGVSPNGPNLNDGERATGCRVTLVFEGGVPDISAPEVKALLYPLVDFNVKTGVQAYAETLPEPIRRAIATHQVLVGMDREMVIASMGAPESKVRESEPSGEHYEDWIYGHQPQTVRFVRFIGDRVSLVKVAKLGQPIEIHDQNELAGVLPPPPERTVAEGDSARVEGQRGPPTLSRPGEKLDVADADAPQSGKVQYPVPKKPAAQDESDSKPAAATPPASQPPLR